ncbi:MAG: glycosyltransferase [bacterium]
MKTIALVQDWLTGFAGGEQVLLALHEMYPDAPIYTSLYAPEKVPQFANATVIPSYLQKVPGLLTRHQTAIPLMPLAFESFDLKGFDVVISVGGGLSKGVITQPDQTHISYCHTPMRYLWHIGGDSRASGSWLKSQAAHKLRIWDVVSASRVDRFLANSQTVADRIAKIYRQDATVVYPPVNTSRFHVATDKPGDYFLSVGRLISYKRVDLAVEACIKTKQPLKIAGTGPESDSLKAMAKNAPWIEFLGRVPDAELEGLYQGARAFIFPAEEDFGIVPVEAMSVGRPVIAFGKGGATESVVEGVSGTFFDKQEGDSLGEKLTAFKDADWDPAAIRQQAERFDVELFKKTMKEIVDAA